MGNNAGFSDRETNCFWPVSYRLPHTLALSADPLTGGIRRSAPSPLSARGHPGVPHSKGTTTHLMAACWASQTNFTPLLATVSKLEASVDPLLPGLAASQTHLGAPFLHSLLFGGS